MMHRTIVSAAALLGLAITFTSPVSAQLSEQERMRAESVARIQAQEQAKVLEAQRQKDRIHENQRAEQEAMDREIERSKDNIERRRRGRLECEDQHKLWDAYNEVCRNWRG